MLGRRVDSRTRVCDRAVRAVEEGRVPGQRVDDGALAVEERHVLGHRLGGHGGRPVDAEGAGAGRGACREHPRDRGQGQLVHRVREGAPEPVLVLVEHGQPPHRDGLLVGARIRLVGAHHPLGDLGVVARTVGTGPPERVAHQSGLGVDVETGERDVDLAAVAAQLVGGHLESGRGRLAPHRVDPHPVTSGLGQPDRVEAGGDVGAQVAGRIDLVEQLRGDRPHGDLAAGAVVLAYDRRAVGRDLGPREAGPVHALHFGEERVVAAGGLGAALDDVPGRHRAGQDVPVVDRPVVVPGGGTADHRRVGDSPGHHDVGAAAQGLGDSPAAQVGVGGDELRRVGHRLTGGERP